MLKINLLGRTSSNLNGSPTLAFRTRKAEAILYYLVMAAQPIDRSTIAELFWSDMTTANAQKNLRSVLPGLRDLLGDYLLITNRQITFNQSLEHLVDLYELQRVLANSSLTHAEKFSQFTKYYQGELLAGLSIANAPEFESWLAQQREVLQQTITIALQQWTEHFLEQKNFKLGLEATHIWLKMQPWSEIAHGLRMQLFWRSKQRSAALLQYNQCCTYLEDELGVEPSAGIKALYIQIQKDSVPLASESQEKEASQPVPRPKAPTHNLPRRIMSYVGRTAEIETLLDYLLKKNHPLISIVGEGGIGKTSLALTVAERLAAKIEATPYSDGIWLISCAGVDAGFSAQEQLVISIATTIGMQFQGTNPFLEQLTDYLANKSMLLIIDNFEHLAEHITLLWSWVQQTKTVQFLITSRHNLNLQSNLPLYLTGLEIPPFAQNNLSFLLSADDLAHLQSFPIVQLLQERATKAWPNFVVNQQNGVAVAKLCHLLDGNPLALELAATLLINYDIATIYTELLDNYTLLAAELNELPLRQRSIHNTIDYTWQMLSPELATLMAQCSSFRGIFTCQAVTAITGQSIQKVNQLTQRSMLYMDTQRNLHIHSMMQQFAAQKLQENAAIAQATKQKHSEYFIGLLSTWWENSESQHIVAKLLPHLDNIYAAWDWAFNHQAFGLLSRTIIPFTQFHIYAGLLWDVQLLIQSYQQKLEEQRAILPEISPGIFPDEYQQMQTALTYARTIFHYQLGNYEQVPELMHAAQTQVHQHGYLHLAANLEHYLANFNRLALRFTEAQQHFEQAIRYAKEQKQPYSWIPPLISLALNANQHGRFAEAADYLQQTYEYLQEYPDVSLEASYYGVLSALHFALGHWSDALDCGQKAIEIGSQQRNPVHDYHSIGKLLSQGGRYELAKEYLERIDSTNQHYLYRPGTYWHTVWLIEFANLYVAWQQPEQALFYSHLARGHAQKHGWAVVLGRVLKAEGSAQMQLSQWQEAKKNLTQAYALFLQESALDYQCATLTKLIQLHLALEDRPEIAVYSESIWDLLHSDKLDNTNSEPIKAWWACYLGFRALGESRAQGTLQRAIDLLQTQRAYIYDETWKEQFSTQIPEHRDLFRAAKELLPDQYA